MKSPVLLAVRLLRRCLYNSPVRNWKITAYLYGKVGRAVIGNDPFPVVEYLGVKLKTNGADTSITTALMNGHYENYTLEILRKLLEEAEKDPVVFADVGANIGIFTIMAAARHPAARIYAFEPNPVSFGLLRENLNLHSLGQVTAVNFAAGEAAGTASLDVSSRCAGMHSLFGPGRDRLEVPLVSLDEFFGTAGVQPNLVKIDVEGYERNVLAGMKTLLRSPLRIILEFNPEWLQRGGQDPAVFLAELADDFDVVYCLDEISHSAFRYESENEALKKKCLFTGFNLLLIKGAIPSFLEI